MKCATTFVRRGYVSEIPRMRAYAGARTVLRIRGIEMPATIQAIAAQQVAELMHMKPVLPGCQIFNVPRHLHRLIGAARNGGLIPYDDDIDIGILEKDCDKIDAYHDDDEVYYFEKIFFGYKFKKKNSDMFVDIMVFENKNNEYKIINDSWPNEAFNNINEIFPLKQITYNEMLINAPNSYKTYLDRAFPKWDTKIVINCGHHDVDGCVHERYKIPQEFDINYDNFKYTCYSKFPNT